MRRCADQARGRKRVGRCSLAVIAHCTCLAIAVLVLAVMSNAAGAQAAPASAPNTSFGRIYSPNTPISQPFVLATSHTDYLYSTGGQDSRHVPVRSFAKMGNWVRVADAMPALPRWAESGSQISAPDVRKVGAHYIMWFSGLANVAASGSSGGHERCIGWASSTNPLGPFSTSHSPPPICQSSVYAGAFDPRTFVVSGKEYLLWASNGPGGARNAVTDRIFVQSLATDGLTLEGSPVELLRANLSWEENAIASPDMLVTGSRYYLVFSGGIQSDPGSGIGFAPCQGPEGPCPNTDNGPWLGSNSQGAGPNRESLFQQDGATWLAYAPNASYYDGAFPTLAVSRVALDGGALYVANFGKSQPNP